MKSLVLLLVLLKNKRCLAVYDYGRHWAAGVFFFFFFLGEAMASGQKRKKKERPMVLSLPLLNVQFLDATSANISEV
jgi:hypothetical protein